MSSLLSRWFDHLARRAVAPAQRAALGHAARLRLEALEDRAVPAGHTWTGGGGDNLWSNPGNWDGGVPTSDEAGTLVAFLGGTSSVMDIVGLRVNRFDFLGTNNTITLSTPLAMGITPTIVCSDGTHTITGSSLDIVGPCFTAVGAGSTLSIASSISVAAGFFKTESGTLSVRGTQTFTGDTFGIAGTLDVPAGSSLINSRVGIGGGTLTGGGTIGTVLGGGPGPDGLIVPGGGTGTATLTIGTGNFNELTYRPALSGANSDRINLIGLLDLTGSALSVQVLQTPTAASYTLIDNAGADAITGTFNGLPEGSAVFVGGQAYTLSYVGGTGNDVVLTRAGEPPVSPDPPVVPPPARPAAPAAGPPAPALSGASVAGNILVLSGAGVRDAVQLVSVPLGSFALFTDVTSDGDGDVILFLPSATLLIDGRTGRPMGLGADDNGDGVRDLLIFNPDSSTTRIDGRTGIVLVF